MKTFGSERSRRIYIVVGLIITTLVLLLTGLLFLSPNAKAPYVTSAPPDMYQVEGRYLFSGTIVLARAVERDARGDYDQPFSQLNSFNPAQYDGWLADLECPAVDTVISYFRQIEELRFNCHPDWFPALKKHFSMFSLANNHTGDLGADNFVKTQQNLQQAGFQTVGSPDPSSSKDACEIVALQVRLKKQTGEEKGTLPVALCAFHYFFKQPAAGEMDIVKEYAKYMPVFGLMHAGVEYRPGSDDTQKQVARTLIDNGASFVIGNSPHWVQESEVYKGKPIFYSTGNFIFDQLEPEEQRGLSIAVDMKLTGNDVTAQWLKLGPQCQQLYDSCLESIKQQGLKPLNVRLTYKPVGSSGGVRKITQLADPALQASIEQRLDWSKTKMELGQ